MVQRAASVAQRVLSVRHAGPHSAVAKHQPLQKGVGRQAVGAVQAAAGGGEDIWSYLGLSSHDDRAVGQGHVGLIKSPGKLGEKRALGATGVGTIQHACRQFKQARRRPIAPKPFWAES